MRENNVKEATSIRQPEWRAIMTQGLRPCKESCWIKIRTPANPTIRRTADPSSDPALGENTDPGYCGFVAADPSKKNPPAVLAGKLLLADPSLRDSIFDKSVVLIHDHNREQGAMGLILNQPTGHRVGEFLKDPQFKPLAKLSVHKGGPVEPHQMTFSSFWWSKKSGLQWAIRLSAEEAAAHIKRPGRIVRAFIGYSGWSAGQLENELKQAAWITIAPQSALLGQAHDRELWGHLLGSISPLHRLMAMAPDDLMLN